MDKKYYPERAWFYLQSLVLHQTLDHTANSVKYVRADLIEKIIAEQLHNEHDVLAGEIEDALQDVLAGKYTENWGG